MSQTCPMSSNVSSNFQEERPGHYQLSEVPKLKMGCHIEFITMDRNHILQVCKWLCVQVNLTSSSQLTLKSLFRQNDDIFFLFLLDDEKSSLKCHLEVEIEVQIGAECSCRHDLSTKLRPYNEDKGRSRHEDKHEAKR